MKVRTLRRYLSHPHSLDRNIAIVDRNGHEYAIVGFGVSDADPNTFTLHIGKIPKPDVKPNDPIFSKLGI
jgi:hypothetical protein